MSETETRPRPNVVESETRPRLSKNGLKTGLETKTVFEYYNTAVTFKAMFLHRERTKLVYSMYSRMSGETVQRNLMKLGVDFFILEDSWCTRRTRPGCSMPEIWDVEDPDNVGKTPFCTQMSNDPWPYFTTVFSNDVYKVLGVPKDLR